MNRKRLLPVVLLLVAIGVVLYFTVIRGRADPGDLAASGTVEATEAALSTPDERSIMPTFACTRADAVSVSAEVDVAAVPASDPPPQAASGSVTTAHRRTLRICERAARANLFM